MKKYIEFNWMPLPNPDSYAVNIEDVTEENETEAGTKQVIMVRKGRYKLDVSFTCTSTWLKKITEYRNLNSISVGFYDPYTDEKKELEMRITGYKAGLIEGSEEIKKINGVWNVSFSLEEF